MKTRPYYVAMVIGGLVGMVAAFLQTLEKLVLLQNSQAVLPCNFNSVFNCSAVLQAWQSSLFGFPNSIMCLVLFTIFTVAGVAGLSSTLGKPFRLGVQALTLFTLGFALWFLWQSTYVIGALCIFCLFCFAGLLLVNWAWLRLNVDDLPIGSRMRTAIKRLIQADVDIALWLALGVVVGLLMFVRFGL
jgi:uncharacterized membrane protein